MSTGRARPWTLVGGKSLERQGKIDMRTLDGGRYLQAATDAFLHVLRSSFFQLDQHPVDHSGLHS